LFSHGPAGETRSDDRYVQHGRICRSDRYLIFSR
jgi:hypothetical protein